ncbi:carbohydrate ABC transporter permease [Thioalkalicoccus limnaeus]|uniref:Carbohydrate ABC transporter permease n=1 Tax=Thioalkalicoccus limnaeus TaxID=120681 RepID=A0ABV4BK26_9GAMM
MNGRPILPMIATYLVLLAVTLVFFGPVLFMLVGSLKPDELVLAEAASWRGWVPESVSLENYRSVFERVPFGSYLASSLVINGTIVGLGLVVNAFAGYALARLQWWGREAMLAVVLAILVIPFEAIAIPLFYQLSALGWRDDHLVQAIPFVANPLAIYLFYSFFLGLPKALEEAARIDGAGVFRTFVAIVIPNSRAAFASVAIVTFLFHWGIYLWPLLMTTSESVRPLPLGIATFYTLPPLAWGDILAFGVLMVLPVLVVFVVFQRWFVAGVAATGIKG